jgi:hypothetical protein
MLNWHEAQLLPAAAVVAAAASLHTQPSLLLRYRPVQQQPWVML